MSPSAADVLNVARSYLGVAEDPPHSNDTVIGEKFGWNGVPWCAESVSVWEREAGVPFTGSASCSVLVGRYQDGTNGTWGVDPQPGDEGFLGTRGQDHTFLIEANNGDGTVTTIEGNWGDKVTRVRRTISSIFGFGRPRYDDAAAPDLPPPSSTGGRPILRQGNVSASVGTVQTFLNAFDSAGLTVDNDFGPATDAAVRAWQSKRSLTVDGEVGPQTWADFDATIAYVTALAQPNPQPSIPTFPGTTRLGSRGDAVTAVQSRLRDRGWKIGVDGVFGHETDAIVRQFQGEKSLTVDGIAGPATWVALWSSPIT